ncbi:MAG: acetyl-CoA carboxylase biotin carboxyl carrier protein [Bacteroidota bacterium]
MELKEIQELIRQVNKLNIAEVSIEEENFKLTIKTHDPIGNSAYTIMPAAMPAAPQPAAIPAAAAPVSIPAEAKPAAAAPSSTQVTIKSPMIGTFYRASGPDKPACVNVGDEIKNGTVLCIIEAMKLFNEIESEHTGRIVKILVENAQPVEYDQPLFIIEPM